LAPSSLPAGQAGGEYSLTKLGYSLKPILDAMKQRGERRGEKTKR